MFYKVKQAMSSRADDLCRGDWPVVLEVKGMSSATWILKTISNLSVTFAPYTTELRSGICLLQRREQEADTRREIRGSVYSGYWGQLVHTHNTWHTQTQVLIMIIHMTAPNCTFQVAILI